MTPIVVTATPAVVPTTTPSAPIAIAVGGALVSRSDDEGASWHDIFNVFHVLGVDFVDRLRGWVVGDGLIYRTITGGVGFPGWESQVENVEGPPLELFDVGFVDSEHGVAIGGVAVVDGGPAIIVTADAGARWRRADSAIPRTTWLTRLCLSNDGRGVAVGNGVVRGEPPLAVITTDAGEHWRNVTATLTFTAGSDQLTIAGCARPGTTTWVVGAPSFAATTSDDGHTWTVTHPTDRRDALLNAALFTDDGMRGWIAGFDAAARAIFVLVTRDGGMTWREHVLLDDVLVLEAQPTAMLAAFDAETIVLVGSDPNSFALEGSRAFSFVTRDGGETWTASVIPGGYQEFTDVDVVR